MDYFDLSQPSRPLAERGVRRREIPIPGDQLHVGLAVSELPIARSGARLARPQLRRRLLRTAVHLRPRCIPGQRRRTDRAGPRLSGEHASGSTPRAVGPQVQLRSASCSAAATTPSSARSSSRTRAFWTSAAAKASCWHGWPKTKAWMHAASRSRAPKCSKPSRAAFRSFTATSKTRSPIFPIRRSTT